MRPSAAHRRVRTALTNRAVGFQVGVAFVEVSLLLALAGIQHDFFLFLPLSLLLLAVLLMPDYFESLETTRFAVESFLSRLFKPEVPAILYISVLINLGLFPTHKPRRIATPAPPVKEPVDSLRKSRP